MKNFTAILTALMITFGSFTAFAAGKTIYADVNGLVCDFCAQALEKVFSKEASVEDIDVNLDTKVITIQVKEGQDLSEEKITDLITDAGYNVEQIRYTENK